MTEHLGLPSVLAFGVISAEFCEGAALIVGLFSRIAAVGIGLIALAAILMLHDAWLVPQLVW